MRRRSALPRRPKGASPVGGVQLGVPHTLGELLGHAIACVARVMGRSARIGQAICWAR